MDKTKLDVYLETSVISYLAAKQSTDTIKASRQAISKQLWDLRGNYNFYVSDIVIQESALGYPSAAQARQYYIDQLKTIQTPEETEVLAKKLIEKKAIPEEAYVDATHIACASLAGIETIVSWNFKHLVGLVAKQKIEQALIGLGINPTKIVTPEQLIGGAS